MPFIARVSVSSLKNEQIEAAVHLLRSKDVAAILQTGIVQTLIYQLYVTAKEIGTYIEAAIEANRRDERALESFNRFVNKGRRASADWRSEIQACFRKTA